MSTDTSKSRVDLPQEFIRQMENLLGEEEASALCEALETDSPTSVRRNRQKLDALPFAQIQSIPWCSWGGYLVERPSFTTDPLLHAGGYYVQEASSMLLALLTPHLPEYPLMALDFCAAPGGKSTLLLDLLPKGSVLVSNEVVRHRANILMENMQKWGSPYSIITSAMPRAWEGLRHCFDLMLVDAPCSGEGMFRKDMGARAEWSPSNVQVCISRQREILDNIWEMLKPGGLLVYSTCTFNPRENEDQLSYIVDELGAIPLSLDLPEDSGIIQSQFSVYPAYRMMPHRVSGEGIFMAVVRKSGDMNTLGLPTEKSRKKGGKTNKSTSIPPIMKEWVNANYRTDVEYKQLPSGEVYAYPSAVSAMLYHLQQVHIPILSAGIPLGEVKGTSVIPHPALAYSWAREVDAFPTYETSRKEALAFLAKDTSLTLPLSLERGILLLTYRGLGLGFVKHLGNRTNNLFPDHWRIRNLNLIRELEE